MTQLKPNINFLKLVAIVSMTIDHVNTIYFQGIHLYATAFGRLAYPLFAFILAYNYLHHSSNPRAYIQRLAFFAVASQPVYIFALQVARLNILFTLLFGLLCLYWLKNTRYRYVPLIILPAVGFYSYFREITLVAFGMRGVLLVYLFGLYLAQRKKSYLILLLFLLGILNVVEYDYPSLLFALSSLSSLLLIRVSGRIKPDFATVFRIRMFFYFYYPLHLLAIRLGSGALF